MELEETGMYRVIIEFRDDLPDEKKMELKKLAINAYNNRGGNSYVPSNELNICRFEYKTEDVLALGNMLLDEVPGIKECMTRWDWIDEEHPYENCSIKDELIAFESEQE